jgi:hypothetical protein
MVGIPGQSIRSLAEDIDLFATRLDMIGIGPFIPNPHTLWVQANWLRPLIPPNRSEYD